MKNKLYYSVLLMGLLAFSGFLSPAWGQAKLSINDQGYFEMPGLDIMVFDDYYAMGHQGGITIIQNGVRVAANGDIRIDGWSEKGPKKVDIPGGTIQAQMSFPKIPLQYSVQVKAAGNKIIVTVDLNQPLPSEWTGKAWFQIELFPPILYGKSWNMDGQTGIFPTDAYGPMAGIEVAPYAAGKVLAVAPETENQRLTIKALKGTLQLVDNRTNNKASWFAVRTALPSGQTKSVVEWEIEAVPAKDFKYSPVIHISQVGYLPGEPKKAIIELDKGTSDYGAVDIMKINQDGSRIKVLSAKAAEWGKYLRFKYAICDFSALQDTGMYIMQYGNVNSELFRISEKIFDRYVWQPTLEYFLPVQMCHMRVEQGSRVWHSWCHLDDAVMAPTDHIHFDSYKQGPETFTDYKNPQHVPFLDRGGWHDAGDYDLRIESQSVTTWRLAQMIEQFGINLDITTIDQQKRMVYIHKPDGVSDVLQQVEHGVLTILGGYKGLGRLYRGMISPTTHQYGLQGDGSAQTDNLNYNRDLPEGAKTAFQSSVMDDNWVFTEDNARHELIAVATLAAASRVLKDYRPEMSTECINAAEDLFEKASKKAMVDDRIAAAAELFTTTKNKKYIEDITTQKDYILAHMKGTAWGVGMIYKSISDPAFRKEIDAAVKDYSQQIEKEDNETPFGVPYKPDVWGAGWTIQSLGVQQYFLVKGFPGVFKADRIYNAMQFVLGCHPGSNTSSFDSGVGVKSLIPGYGVNRADLSYIPGGVAAGTAIIRPDFPELKENWSFLWQQTEYVMGGGETNFMFLVLATNQLLKK